MSNYGKLKNTWSTCKKYTYVKPHNLVEDYGAFSISSAVRGSYNRDCANCNKYNNGNRIGKPIKGVH
jgi:hypothetical protein